MCYGSILESAMREARKQHWCDICHGRIEVGDRYEVLKTSDHGDISTSRMHRVCVAIGHAARVADNDGCFYGDPREHLKEEAREHGWRALLAEARALFVRRGFKRAAQRSAKVGEGET